MSEAIIARRGGLQTSGSIDPPTSNPSDIIITSNGTYTCPRTGYYLIQCIGGGGSGSLGNTFNGTFAWARVQVSLPDGRYTTDGNNTMLTSGITTQLCHMFGGGGGGSGYFNSGIILLNQNQSVNITVGQGANARMGTSTGGTTSFGTYLYASGGTAGNNTVVKPAQGNVSGFYVEFFELPGYEVNGELAIGDCYYIWSSSRYLTGGSGYDNGSSGEYSFLYDPGNAIIGTERNVADGGMGGYIKIDSNNIAEPLENWAGGGGISNYGRGGSGNTIRRYYRGTNIAGHSGAVIIKWHSNA